MQTSPFIDLESAALRGDDAPPATNAEKLVDDVAGEAGAESVTGDARANGNTSTQFTSGALDESQNAARDFRDGDMANQPSAIPQIATRYPGSMLLAAMALGFLLGRAVSRR